MSWLSRFFDRFRKQPAAPVNPPAPDPTALEPVRPPTVQPAPPAKAQDRDYVKYPGTHNFGDWRDALPGETEEEYWQRTHLAGFGKTTEQIYAEDQARIGKTDSGKLSATERYHGPIPVASLTGEEKAFLTYVTANYRLPDNAWFAILAGSLGEINLAINTGDPLVKSGGWTPDAYIRGGGRLVPLVDQVARGLLKPVVTHEN